MAGKRHKGFKNRRASNAEQNANENQIRNDINPDVIIDGTTLEGGGQLLRIALCLSALTNKSIQICNIRGNRSGRPGLGNQHMACVRSLADLCDAYTIGAKVGSSDLLFAPGQGGRNHDKEQTIDLVHHGEKISARQVTVDLTTPGAVTLVLQAVLPYLLFKKQKKPIVLTLQGGTHTTSSPSIDYIHGILLRNLKACGLPYDSVQLLRQTPYQQQHRRKQMPLGQVCYLIRSLADHSLRLGPAAYLQSPADTSEDSSRLCPYNHFEVHAHILFGSAFERSVFLDPLLRDLALHLKDARFLREIDILHTHVSIAGSSSIETSYPCPSMLTGFETPKHTLPAGTYMVYVLLFAEPRLDGARIGVDYTHTSKYYPLEDSATSFVDRKSKSTAAPVVDALKDQVEACRRHGTDLDLHMQDQVVVFLGLLGGRVTKRKRDSEENENEKWTVEAGEKHDLSLHAQTAIWTTQLMLGVKFDADGMGVKEGWLAKPPIENEEHLDAESKEDSSFDVSDLVEAVNKAALA